MGVSDQFLYFLLGDVSPVKLHCEVVLSDMELFCRRKRMDRMESFKKSHHFLKWDWSRKTRKSKKDTKENDGGQIAAPHPWMPFRSVGPEFLTGFLDRMITCMKNICT